MNDTTATVIARYLAVGGARVTGTARYRPVEADDAYATDCEACGPLSENDDHFTELDAARDHAASCRRIPERLWTGGEA